MDKILLVDDVNLLREKKKGLLSSSRVHILTASDGHEALAVARKELPNLIVMDNHLPAMDGVSCCQAIKTDPHLKHIPVVILTNAVQPSDSERCSATAANDWISKPVDGKRFLSTLKKYLPARECRVLRVPLRTEVRLTIHDGFHVGMTNDVSPNGIYVTSELQPVPGDEVRVSFVLPGSEAPTEARGKVAWFREKGFSGKSAFHSGFGVEFLEITGKGIPSIRKSELESFVSLRAGDVAADPVWI
jgi:CheY-like chemotaxis protein